MTEGKGVGMTEGQWNDIVLDNLRKHNAEQEAKKAKLAQQRAAMKDELRHQMEARQKKEKDSRVHDVEQWKQHISLHEQRRQAEEELRRKRASKYNLSGSDMAQQVDNVQKARHAEELTQKEMDARERRRVEESVKAAEAEEARKREEKRLKLKQITEEDRKLKADFKKPLNKNDF